MGVSKANGRIRTDIGWSRELQEQIAQTRAIELETLHEEFFLLMEGQIRFLGEKQVVYK